MTGSRIAMSVGLGAMIAAGLGASPALFAQEQRSPRVLKRLSSEAMPLTGIGSFTPASADPRLVAALSRTGLNATGFQFTPSEGAVIGNRTVKVAVRSRTLRPNRLPDRVAAAAPMPTLNPLAYNLGVSVGWKRFAVSGDLARLDLAGQPGSREQMGLGVSYTGRKLAARVGASSDRPLADQPALIADPQGYSLDMGGSYKLTRNLDVTAGVRYRSERERMLRVDPDRRDSQAVYVGTAFRF
ncbi:hypothetical protein [Sphingomonas sp. Leaf4]|uniref:hypothetical protein n=2 Tax=Sphingomonas TaxID=13687 RepID=UPI000B0A08FB|nr:hypothetical protein [Sphingomonas sp. Leaf4]